MCDKDLYRLFNKQYLGCLVVYCGFIGIQDPRQFWFALSSVVVNNAWVEYSDDVAKQSMYTEDLLIFTAADYNSNGQDSCEQKTMGLVGQHLVTKTKKNPAWTWATFEHNNSAPFCSKSDASSGVNSSCPTTDKSSYILNACAGGESGCEPCNTAPSICTGGLCIDNPENVIKPAQLCRQITNSQWPSQAAGQDYQLIATQWFQGGGSGDINNAPTVRQNSTRESIMPHTVGKKSVVGNASMESYERSNCIGCHSSSVYKQSSGQQISTDYMFWMTVEVPCGANGNNQACMD